MTATVDDRGRILIPKEMREHANLEPGQSVRVEAEADGTLRVRPVLEPGAFLERLTGVISDQTRREGAEPVDPVDLKKMWEPAP